MNTTTEHRADCGHTYTPPGPAGGAAGYAKDPETGRTMCYPCADKLQREEMRTGTITGGYVNETRRQVTTWTGGDLMRITGISYSTKRYGSMGWWRMRYITAVTEDGRVWHGQGSDQWDAVTMRTKDRPRVVELVDPAKHAEHTERDTVECGNCHRMWCDRCTPTPAARCPFEYEH